VQDLIQSIEPIFRNIWFQITLLVLFATLHGYAGAWLAVRMLFRPRNPVRFLGIPIFPQGMIPRHRAKLAAAIGKAVGEELVSTDTIHEQLIEKEFLRNKIQTVVDSYTDELLSQEYPSLIEALPKGIREPILDAVSGLQHRLAEHIRDILTSDESQTAIASFVTRRVDDILGRRVSEVVDDETFEKITAFVETRIRSAVQGQALETNIADFVSRRLDELVRSETPLGEMFTSDAVALLKEKANEQIEPTIHQLAEVASSQKTRDQIGALIKQEVHDFYHDLSFFKKIFVSRENLLDEVDELVNESLPKRIEEALRGTYFADEARTFISTAIDNALARPLPVVIGTVAPEQLDRLKAQVTSFVLKLMRSEETLAGITRYFNDTLQKLRPHSIDAILAVVHTDAEEKLKSMLSRGLIDILTRDETLNIINDLLASQIDRVLSKPIGRLSDHVSESRIREASRSLTDAMISAINTKLPDAIRDFDVGRVVREKVEAYPADKLESLVLSVAKEHLRKIELFGALFGFLIGLVQAIQFYLYAK
jgi:uncharacterized membrane protein YheB (UPF0754 family)